MTYQEAIETIEVARGMVEWEYPLDFACAFDMAIDALGKQVPKKPRKTRCSLMCFNCGHKITEKECVKANRNFCKKCGQAIDWTEDETDGEIH